MDQEEFKANEVVFSGFLGGIISIVLGIYVSPWWWLACIICFAVAIYHVIKLRRIRSIGKGDSFESATLLDKLTSDNESIFQAGMNEAVSIADSGNSYGVEVMREAIKIRAGNDNISFYEPGMVLTEVERYTEARSMIIELVKKNALLDDVYHSGDLISAFMFTANSYGEDARALLDEIVLTGGPSEGHAFQLLFNELRCSSRLKKGMS